MVEGKLSDLSDFCLFYLVGTINCPILIYNAQSYPACSYIKIPFTLAALSYRIYFLKLCHYCNLQLQVDKNYLDLYNLHQITSRSRTFSVHFILIFSSGGQIKWLKIAAHRRNQHCRF